MPIDAHVARLRSLKGKGKAVDAPAERSLILLVLLADTPIESVQRKLGYKSYHDVFCSLFRRSLDQIDNVSVEIIVKSYDVVNDPWEYPSEEDLSSAAGLLITGSGASKTQRYSAISRICTRRGTCIQANQSCPFLTYYSSRFRL